MKELEKLAELVDSKGNAYDTLVKSYNVIPASTHEGRVAQAMFMAQNFPDFATRFSKEVAHEHGYAELGFDFMSIISGVGKAVGGVFTAIGNAVKNAKAKKAAAATTATAAKTDAAKTGDPKPGSPEEAAAKKKKMIIAAVVGFTLLGIAAAAYFMNKGKKGKKGETTEKK